jgi:hypothetical protein
LDSLDPRLLHFSRPRTAFPTNYHPVNSAEIDRAQVLQERFNAQESNDAWCPSKEINTRQPILSVFDANAPPDVRISTVLAQFIRQKVKHPLGTFS